MIERMILMAGCVARTPFRTQVEAAAKAGFDGLTIWPNIWRHATTRGGMTLRDMRALLDDNGLVLTDVEGIPEWPPGSAQLDACAELGGQRVVAMQLDPGPFDLAREADRFASFDEAARSHGLKTAVEFVSFGGLTDAATAWRLVQLSGSPDAGIVVDLAHHVRSGRNDAALFAIPPARIVAVQLADGPAAAPADIRQEATFGRFWPGEGDFDVAGFLARLATHGAHADVGLELYHPDFAMRDPDELIAEIAARTRALLSKSDTIAEG
jgi:4-hydroxyphenylpyruvate dioxygenase